MTKKVEFTMEKATKNTIKFTEVLENELAAPTVGTIYVPKMTLGMMGWNSDKKLIVTLEVEK